LRKLLAKVWWLPFLGHGVYPTIYKYHIRYISDFSLMKISGR